MDPEELRMAHTIRSRNPDGDTLKPEGVRKLYITHGKVCVMCRRPYRLVKAPDPCY